MGINEQRTDVVVKVTLEYFYNSRDDTSLFFGGEMGEVERITAIDSGGEEQYGAELEVQGEGEGVFLFWGVLVVVHIDRSLSA